MSKLFLLILVSNSFATSYTLNPFSEARGSLRYWQWCVVIPFLLLLFLPYWIALVWLLPLAAVAYI